MFRTISVDGQPVECEYVYANDPTPIDDIRAIHVFVDSSGRPIQVLSNDPVHAISTYRHDASQGYLGIETQNSAKPPMDKSSRIDNMHPLGAAIGAVVSEMDSRSRQIDTLMACLGGSSSSASSVPSSNARPPVGHPSHSAIQRPVVRPPAVDPAANPSSVSPPGGATHALLKSPYKGSAVPHAFAEMRQNSTSPKPLTFTSTQQSKS